MHSEFDFINNIKKKFDLRHVGDDCAVLPKDAKTDLLITADLLVQDVDFRLDWTTPEYLGHKVLAVSLSDIAAMGGTPLHAMLSIGVPAELWKTDFLDRFYEGWHTLAREFDVELVGGDVSRADACVIDSIVMGETARSRAFLRSGARHGDAIYVSGTLGGSAAGLKLLEDGHSEHALIHRHLAPLPRLSLAAALSGLNLVTSMIDVSDGFAADLAHICRASDVGATVDAGLLPIDERVVGLFGDQEALDLALHGGEDYELVFTCGPESASAFEGLQITRVGKINSESGTIGLTRNNQTTTLPSRGFRHF